MRYVSKLSESNVQRTHTQNIPLYITLFVGNWSMEIKWVDWLSAEHTTFVCFLVTQHSSYEQMWAKPDREYFL